MSRAERWTRAELEECLALRATMTWAEIGALYDTSGASLRVTACKFRHGKLKFAEDRSRAIRAEIVDRVMKGEPNSDLIARQIGVSRKTARYHFDRIGMQRPERDRYAAMADRVDSVSRV